MSSDSEIKRSPFRSNDSIYQGPQQLALAGAVKRASVASDSVLTVTGPAGVGKTASAIHAVRRNGDNSVIGRVGRMRLEREDVVELLLKELKARHVPASALQRFVTLKSTLTDFAEDGADVFIIVEDVERLGTECLIELEALTAAESDETPGAHLVLMGKVDMRRFLDQPVLARLQQRVYRSISIEPFSISETRGYIEHCVKNYGSDEEISFDPAAVDIVHGCSGGIARFINTVAENMIVNARESGIPRITGTIARDVASDCYGYEHDDAELSESSRTAASDGSDAHSRTTGKTAANAELAGARETAATDAELTPTNDTVVIEDNARAHIPEVRPPLPTSDIDEQTAKPDSDLSGKQGSSDSAASVELSSRDVDKSEAPLPASPVDPINPGRNIGDASSGELDNRIETDSDAEAGTARADDSVNGGPGDDATEPDHEEHVSTSMLNAALAEAEVSEQSGRPADVEPKGMDISTGSSDADAGDMKICLEPRVPEPLSALSESSDTQTRQALDDALRPDTQLLRFLDEDEVPVEEDGPVPIGLVDAVEPGNPVSDEETVTTGSAVAAKDERPGAEKPGSSPETSSATDDGEKPIEGPEKAPSDELEITLDASLEQKKKEAEARLAEERNRRKAAAAEGSAENEEELKVREEQEQIELVESLSARFSNAKSLEDVVDDKAAETLFGEEFTEMAAAVAAMASSQGLDVDGDSPGVATGVPVGGHAANADSANVPTGELSLVDDTLHASSNQNSGKAPGDEPATGAPVPQTAVGVAPAGGSKHLDSSPSERLKMVRALSGKASSTPVPANGSLGEEIVLGNSSRIEVETDAAPKKPRKPVKGPDENGEFDYIRDDDEPRKKGFLSLFRKS